MSDKKPEKNGKTPGSKETILIDLTKRRDVRRVDSQSEVIQLLALERVKHLVTKLMKESQEGEAAFEDDLFLDRRHNVVTLHGRRGSGKTTFLLHVLKLLKEKEEFVSDASGSIVTLGIIDPTLIESKENVFVSILALIKQKVDDHKRAEQRQQSSDGAAVIEDAYKSWQEALLKLAGGLTLLDGVGKDNPLGEAWENPTYILEKGLKNAKSGAQLERSFHDFIDKSLKFLGSKVFVLALDDIDTDFGHGWAILEVLRKYMTSRKLIVFLCGNLELYSMLVRNEKWSLFDDSLMKKDNQRWPQYREMVSELQSQYLQKVLKPENRVEIRPLSYYVFNEAAYEVNARIDAMSEDTGKRDVGLRELLDAACLNGFFLTNGADRQDVCEIILRQPLRTVIQLMAAANQTLATHWDPGQKPHLAFDDRDNSRSIEDFQEQLPSVFVDNLLASNLDFDKLSVTRDAIIPAIVTFLTSNDRWQEGYRLKPEFHEDDFSLSALALGLRFAREANRHPHLILDYLIKIGLTREGLLGLSARQVKVTNPEYIRFVGLDANDSALQVARKSLAVVREQANGELSFARTQTGTFSIRTRKTSGEDKNRFWSGSSPLLAGTDFDEKITKGKYKELKIGTHYNTLSSLKNNVKSWHNKAITIPAENAIDAQRHSLYYYSIFNLIGVVSDLMRTNGSVNDVLTSAAQLRLFPTPNWTSVTIGDERGQNQVSAAVGTPPKDQDQSSGAFAEVLDEWVKQGQSGIWRTNTKDKNGIPLPTHVLAKIWTRFYYTLRQIDHDPPKGQLLGDLFHRSIVAFLNAILVEEGLHAASLLPGSPVAMLLDNPVKSDANFLANLERWRESRKEDAPFAFPVFTYIFQCPLWSIYLDPSDSKKVEDTVHKIQLESWRRLVKLKEGEKNSAEVLQAKMLKVDYKVGKTKAVFTGLHMLLNTVPLTSVKSDRPASVEDEESTDDSDEDDGDVVMLDFTQTNPKK